MTEAEILSRTWFYRFRLPSGATTESYLPPDVVDIHRTREEMMFNVLDPLFADRWTRVSGLDLACHQGYFSLALATRGCPCVLGVDAREQHIHDARLMAAHCGATAAQFRVGDLTAPAPDLGVFDIVLLFGVLYHVDNPVGVLRMARALTREVCLIETQVVPELPPEVNWGSARSNKAVVGCFGVVDETTEIKAGNMEASTTAVSLCPSRLALLRIARAVGFARAEFVPAPADAYEQFASRQRVMLAAYVE